jgi:hypothetical protein
MEEKARKTGLEVNERKTKYMIMSTSNCRRKHQDLKIEGKLVTVVSSFKYLGAVINNGNRKDNCVKERIQAGNRAHFTNLSTLESKIISSAAKIDDLFQTANEFLPCGSINTTQQMHKSHIQYTYLIHTITHITQNNTTKNKQTKQRKTNQLTKLQKRWRTYYSH